MEKPTEIRDLVITIEGTVSTSNLTDYKGDVVRYLSDIDKQYGKPETPEEFGMLDAAVTVLKDVEGKIKTAKQKALESTADINEFFREMTNLEELVQKERLRHEKTVTAGKEKIKQDIIKEAEQRLINGVKALTHFKHLDVSYSVIGAAAKGKKKAETMKEAVEAAADEEIKRCSDHNDAYSANLNLIATAKENRPGLFPDEFTLIKKTSGEVEAVIKARVAEYDLAILKKQEEAKTQQEQASNAQKSPEEQKPQQETVIDKISQGSLPFGSRPPGPMSFGGVPVQTAAATAEAQPDENTRVKQWEVYVVFSTTKEIVVDIARDIKAYVEDYDSLVKVGLRDISE